MPARRTTRTITRRTAPPAVAQAVVPWSDIAEEFYNHRAAHDCADCTLKDYRVWTNHLVPFLEQRGVTIATLRPPDLDAWLNVLKKTPSRTGRPMEHSTVRQGAVFARMLCKFAYRMGYMERPIEWDIPKQRRKVQPAVRAGDLEKLLAAASKSPDRLRDRALVLMLWEGGMRRSEASRVRWCDLGPLDHDLDQADLAIAFPAKRGDLRTTYVSSRGYNALMAYRSSLVSTPDDGWVFPGADGDGPIKPNTLGGIVRRLADAAGAPDITAHAFRRGCLLALRGTPLASVKRMSGHKTTAILVDIYQQVTPEEASLDIAAARAALKQAQAARGRK